VDYASQQKANTYPRAIECPKYTDADKLRKVPGVKALPANKKRQLTLITGGVAALGNSLGFKKKKD